MGDLESKTFIWNKRKSLSRKTTARLVKYDRELIEKRKKEKVLEVRVSKPNCIICNTCKMQL